METVYRRRTVAGQELSCVEQAFPLSSSGGTGEIIVRRPARYCTLGRCRLGRLLEEKGLLFWAGIRSVNVSHDMGIVSLEHKAYRWKSQVRCGPADRCSKRWRGWWSFGKGEGGARGLEILLAEG